MCIILFLGCTYHILYPVYAVFLVNGILSFGTFRHHLFSYNKTEKKTMLPVPQMSIASVHSASA